MRSRESGYSSRSTVSRSRPCRYSMAMYSSPSSSPKSMTRRLLGWSMRDAAFASRLKRCANAPSAGRDGLRTLMATVFFRFSCVALYTQPMAPRPTMASMRNLSAMVRPTRAS